MIVFRNKANEMSKFFKPEKEIPVYEFKKVWKKVFVSFFSPLN